jgi:hypothetical protein
LINKSYAIARALQKMSKHGLSHVQQTKANALKVSNGSFCINLFPASALPYAIPLQLFFTSNHQLFIDNAKNYEYASLAMQ